MLNLLDKIILFAFSNVPLLKEFDGYKRIVGDFLIVLAAALAALQEVRPELVWVATLSAVAGFLIKIVGEVHAGAKNRQDPL